MSTIGKSPAGDKKSRSSRVAPRRHVDPQDQAGAYDSAEFPVLLRMPDVTRKQHSVVMPVETPPTAATAPPSSPLPETELPESSTASSGETTTQARPSRQRRSSSGNSERTRFPGQDSRLAATTAKRFWSSLPPQAAVGGMLLAIIALCFVLLRESQSPNAPADSMTEWSGGPPQVDAGMPADSPRVSGGPAAEAIPQVAVPTPAPSRRETVAQVPAPPPLSRGNSGEPTPALPTRSEPTPAWPPMSGAAAPAPVGPAAEDTAPVQGWPDQAPTPAASPAPADDSGTALNAPEGAVELPPTPTVRTSLRPSRPTSSPIPSAAQEWPQLPRSEGTLDIPPPTRFIPQ